MIFTHIFMLSRDINCPLGESISTDRAASLPVAFSRRTPAPSPRQMPVCSALYRRLYTDICGKVNTVLKWKECAVALSGFGFLQLVHAVWEMDRWALRFLFVFIHSTVTVSAVCVSVSACGWCFFFFSFPLIERIKRVGGQVEKEELQRQKDKEMTSSSSAWLDNGFRAR